MDNDNITNPELEDSRRGASRNIPKTKKIK